MRCTKCGEPNPPERLECARCGEPLLDALIETGVSLGFAQTNPPAPSLVELTGSLYTPSSSGPTTPTGVTAERTLVGLFGNRYEILAMIGEGGMGRVYKARDRELDKVIALKTIRTQQDQESVQRFKQELILSRRITHKNVVRIYDLGEAEGVKFFTMEFIEGESLKTFIKRQGKVPPAQALLLSRQILGALQEAHEQGVIHRDLKPQNVMVDAQGTPHLMDFGIARSMDTVGHTATGVVMGTPDYMSPEQVRGEKAGTASDIFSFGVILYEMLTGDMPYHADTPISKIMMRLTHKPRAPHELTGGIPRYLENVVQKCMEVDPALRYQTVGQILADLDREHVSRALTLKVQRAVGRHRGAVAAAAALAVAIAGYALWPRPETRRAAATAAAPSLVRTLAIVPFTNATGSEQFEWMRTGLPEMLATDLSQSRYVRPVPGDRVARVLQELGLFQQSRFDEAALESVSKRTQAETLLSGQFVESDGKLRLDLNLRKAGSGVTVPLKVEASSAEVLKVVDDLARRLKEQLDLTPEQIKGDVARPITEVTSASMDALRDYHAGLALLQKGANQAAVPFLERATAKDANFALAWAKLAEAHSNAGQGDEAEAAIDRAQSLADKGALPLVARYQIHATYALVKDDNEKAVDSYTELGKLYPGDPDIQFSRARALEELGKLPEAIAAYERVLEIDPGYGAALLGLGRAQNTSGQSEEAIRSLHAALDTRKFDGDAESMGMIHSILGVAYRDTARYDRALEHFNQSLAYRQKAGNKRGQAVTYFNLGSVYHAGGESDRALAAYRKALAMTREIKDARLESDVDNNIAETYKAAGKLDQAVAALKESMRIETERQDHQRMGHRLNGIADLYRLKGQYDDAMVYLEQAKTHLAQSDRQVDKSVNLTHIGEVRKAQGLYDQALEAFLSALAISEQIHEEMGVAEINHQVADIYVNQGRYGEAFTALQKAVDIYVALKVKPDIAEAKAPLGHFLVTLGQLEAAEKELAEAERLAREVKAEGALPEILLARAELFHLRGQHDEAAKAYEEANIRANVSGQKEVAVESRIELGHLYLEQGKPDNALSLLRRTREEAERARLRPLQSEAAVALAEVYLARKHAEAARKQALDATSIAEKFGGRPMVYRAQVALGEALERLGRGPEALDAYGKAAATLEEIRSSLKPEHAGPFMARADVQGFLRATLPRLEKGGRAPEAAALKKWAR
jgi:tetratricopeptide (TPR) repeat protein/predicted Ser/Thr protein kinase